MEGRFVAYYRVSTQQQVRSARARDVYVAVLGVSRLGGPACWYPIGRNALDGIEAGDGCFAGPQKKSKSVG
jgi:hypothetical protein